MQGRVGLAVHTGGVGSGNLIRVLASAAPDLLTELFQPGRVLEADVVSVFQGRAVLAFGRGIRLEAALETPLQEGQRVKVQVQPRAEGQLSQGEANSARLDTITLKLVATGNTLETAVQQSRIQGQTTSLTGSEPALTTWLPIPLPDGRQGWAQIHVQDEQDSQGAGRSASKAPQIRLWWETPALGPVEVVLDGTAGGIAALLTVAGAESRTQVEANLPLLQTQLKQAGFGEVRLGCKPPRPGEPVEPVRTAGPSRLDRRL